MTPDVDRPATVEGPLARAALAALDWARLVEELTARAATALGRERCAAPPLMDDVAPIRLALARVSQLRALAETERLPLGGIRDVRASVTACVKGELLDGRPLVEIADTLAALASLRRTLERRAEEAPDLRPLAARIVPLPELQSRLSASFEPSGELSAATYPHLAELRGRKASLHAAIKRDLEEIVATDRWDGALQDDYFALRNDRYVVPVKVQARSLDLGIVHDASGSGQTVFVEPREVVGLNNRLKMADAELRREEQAILADLCDGVAAMARDIRDGLDAAGRIDALNARARLSRDLDGVAPEVLAEPRIDLRSVRHPLLVLKGVEVVANDVLLGGGHAALVLSGPNAGGKTVTLKTLGLCALMVRAGMHLPAEAGSSIGIFRHVLTDIGDQQSVEADLSTFSAHVLTLRDILRLLGDGGGPALVLIDEIAVGTDPEQGAALAAAVLRGMLDGGALVAATTHFAPLKALAEVDARFVNGRLEFDAGELRPTYRLTTGHPGRSYAFDIAARLGLPREVLDDARERLEPTHREVEEMLGSLERHRARLERRERELDERSRRDDARRQRLEAERAELDARRRRLRAEAIEEFDREVEGYREVVRGVIRDLQRAPSLAAAERARKRISGQAARAREALAEAAAPPASSPRERVDWTSIRVGDPVRLIDGDREARLASMPDHRGRVEVRVGAARVRCSTRDLAPARRASEARFGGAAGRRPAGAGGGSPVQRGDLDTAVRTVSNTLDLRGQRVDEALVAVDRFLDDASMRGDDAVFILHGYGTGVLRRAVRQHLDRSPYVVEHRPATESQGGDALTAVRL